MLKNLVYHFAVLRVSLPSIPHATTLFTSSCVGSTHFTMVGVGSQEIVCVHHDMSSAFATIDETVYLDLEEHCIKIEAYWMSFLRYSNIKSCQ